MDFWGVGAKKYSIVYADPPWTYRTWTAKGGHKSASAHYETMTTQEICALPVQDLAAEDCALFLWATWPNLLDALKVIEAWGFVYKTVGFVWVKTYRSGKPVVGLGYWTRANTEMCLIATKGHPRRVGRGVSQVIMSVPREHSRKPDEVRDRIVQLMGNVPRIELFARQRVKGWDAWGNEVGRFGRVVVTEQQRQLALFEGAV